jgi:hypothetical protein
LSSQHWPVSKTEREHPHTIFTFVVSPFVCYRTEIRDLGKKLMETVARSVGIAAVKRACKDLKPASMLLVSEMLKPFEGYTVGTAGSAAAAAAAAPTDPATPKRRPSAAGVTVAAPAAAAVAASGLGGTIKRPVTARPRTGSAAPAAPTAAVVAAVAAAAPSGPAFVAALGTARRKDDGAGVCALLPNDQKDTRAKRDKRQHWAVLVDGEARIGEHPDLLAAELAMCVTEPLLAKMTAADFKKRVDAVADLLTSAAVAPQAALDSMDVLLKWMTLCFCEGTRSWAVVGCGVLLRGTEYQPRVVLCSRPSG